MKATPSDSSTDPVSHLRNVSRDLLVYGASSALSRMGGLLTLPLLTRHLTIDEFGIIEMAAVLIVLLATLLRLGAPPTLSRLFVDFERRQQLASLVSSLLAGVASVGVLVTLVISVAAIRLAPTLDTLVGLIAVIALLQAVASIPETVLRMERKIWRYNLLNATSLLFYLGWLVALVSLESVDVTHVLAGQALGGLTALALGLFLVRGQLSSQCDPALFARALRFGGPLLVGRLALRTADPVSRLILFTLTGLPGVALFGVATRISRLLSLPESLFANAWQPYSMLILEQEDQGALAKMFNYYLGMFCSLGIALSAVSLEVVGLLAPPEYSHAWMMIPGLGGAIVLGGATSFTRLGILASQRTSAVVPVYWMTTAAGLALCWLLVESFGPVGASLSACASAGATSVILWHLSDRCSNIRLDRKRGLVLLGLFGSTSFALVTLATTLSGPYGLFTRLALAAAAVALTLAVAFAGTRQTSRSGSLGTPEFDGTLAPSRFEDDL